eukprot:TRINITY_DN422_c5_g1_i1.p1 TRINITY_DN422_c5_g1~~TRINITY_DN422_c5_g1_i1.p1  ORF type:complete len:1371 (+),score=287.25 TRINITY_DN422_c5_g1_i1:66-4178(+)
METPEEDSAAQHNNSERSILKDNRLRKALSEGGSIEKKKWFYVKSAGKWWCSGGRWVPRFVEVRVEPSKGIESLHIWKSDDCQGLTQELNLTKLDSVQKNFLDEKEARQFPISQDSSCHANDEKEKEFRWGHIIFTLTDVDNSFCVDFACESTLHRDSWLDWFEDYLILRETEKMNAPVTIASQNLELAPSLVDKYVEDTFLLNKSRGTSNEVDTKNTIQPCSRLSLIDPPYDRVKWEFKNDDETAAAAAAQSDREHHDSANAEAKEKQRVQYRTIKGSRNGTLTCKGKALWGLKKAEKIVINLDDVKLFVEKEWNSSLTLQYISNPSLSYVLTAESVEHRDNWLRWIQYVKAEPKVEKDLQEGVWREAVLAGDDCREQKCYIKTLDTGKIRLAFRHFSRSLKWENGTDEEGRHTYKNGNSGIWKLRISSESGRIQQTVVGYDIYEEYFQTRAATVPLPLEPSKELLKPKTPTGKPEEKSRMNIMHVVSSCEFITLQYRTLIVEYDQTPSKRRCDTCPWDLDSGVDSDESSEEESDSREFQPQNPEISIDPPEEEAGMTLARAKKKYGDKWNTFTKEEKRQIIVGSGGISEAQAKKEFYALPYAVIKCAKENVGLDNWRYMTKTQQYEACKEYAHMAEKKSTGPSKLTRMFGIQNTSGSGSSADTPEYKKIVKKKKHAKTVFMDVFRSGLLKDVVDAMPDDIENLSQNTPLKQPETADGFKGEGVGLSSQAAIPLPINDIAIPLNATPGSVDLNTNNKGPGPGYSPLLSSIHSVSPPALQKNSMSPAIPLSGPSSPLTSRVVNPAIPASFGSISGPPAVPYQSPKGSVLNGSPLGMSVDQKDFASANDTLDNSPPVQVAVPLRSDSKPKESSGQLFQLPFSKSGIRWGGTDTTVVVAAVQPGSVADQLGVVSGMELLEIDGMAIKSKNDLVQARNNHKHQAGYIGYRLQHNEQADALIGTPTNSKAVFTPQSILNILGTPTSVGSGLLSTPPLVTHQNTFADSFNSLARSGNGSDHCTPLTPLGLSFPQRSSSGFGLGSSLRGEKSPFLSSMTSNHNNPAIAVPLSSSVVQMESSNKRSDIDDLLLDPVPLKTTLDELVVTAPQLPGQQKQQNSDGNTNNNINSMNTFARDAFGSSADDLLSSADDVLADPYNATPLTTNSVAKDQKTANTASNPWVSGIDRTQTQELQMFIDELLIDPLPAQGTKNQPSHSTETPSIDHASSLTDDLLGTPSEYPACWTYLRQSGGRHKKRWCKATSTELIVFKEGEYEIEELFRLDMKTHSLKKDGEMSILIEGVFDNWQFELQSAAACSEWVDWYNSIHSHPSHDVLASKLSPKHSQLPLSVRRGHELVQPLLIQPELYAQNRGAAP